MDLAQLKFVVDTSELKTATADIEKLSGALSKLSKPMQEATTASSKLNKEQAASEQVSTKSTETTKKQTSVLERQKMILEFMTEGFSKGQSSQLAYAKAAGAVTTDLEALGQVLQTQRKLMGTDPFDKSLGALQALKNEYTVTKEVQRLYNAELGLSKSQMEDLAKEKLRLIEKMKLEGASLTDLKNGIIELNSAYIRNASAENNIISSMQSRQKAQQDSVKANQYIINELERVNRLTQDNGNITSATNNAIIRFEKSLRLSGMAASEQVAKLEAYKQSLLSIQKVNGNRQVDYLSRALGPQITDIAVGLATGQSPMMVLLQQGGQLRDQFALAGVAGKDMGDMLTKATLGMVSSVRDVGIAVGGALVGAISAAGRSFLDFSGRVTGATSIVEAFKGKLVEEGGMSARGTLRTLDMLGKALSVLAGGIMIAAIGSLVALGVAMKQVMDQESALSKAINTTGASLGITTDSALTLSKELASSKGNVGSYVTAITEIAKAGGVSSENLKTVATTIVEVSKATGISADTLAKNFSKLGEKPMEALIPLAKELGTIDVATLKHIRNLELAGKHTEAVKVATEAYSGALKESSDRIKKDMGFLETFFFKIGSEAKSMWDKILNIGRKGTLKEQLDVAIEKMKELQAAGGTNTGRKDRMIDFQSKEIAGILEQIAAEQKLGEEKAKNVKEINKFQKTITQQQGPSFKLPEDLLLKQAKEEYKNTTKEIDSEFKTLLAENKSNYELGLADTGTFLATELQLIAEQNNRKIKINSDYTTSLSNVRDLQIKAINDMVNAEKGKSKNSEDMKKIEEQRQQAIKSVTEAYQLLTEGIVSNTEVLKDNSAEQQAKALSILGQETKKLMEGSRDFIKTQDDIIAKRKLALDVEKQTAGLFGAEVERVKAQILMQQSHVDKLSELEQNAKRAKAALDILAASGITPESQNFKKAQGAVELSEEALNAARIKSREAVEKAGYDAAVKYQDLATQRLNSYSQTFEKAFSGMADAIVNFTKTGKLSFSGLIDTMLSDLLRFELRSQMMKMYEGFGGGKGITAAISSMFTAQADGGAWQGGVQKFAKGGTFTNSVVSSPTLFKFAKGTGLMGEAGPEAIMPLRRGSDGSLGVQANGSGSNVSVQVINNSNSQAMTNETVDSKGNRKIEVVIGDMTAGEISRSGSASQKSIKSTFGIQPQLIRR